MAFTVIHTPRGKARRTCRYTVEADDKGFLVLLTPEGFERIGYTSTLHKFRVEYADFPRQLSEIVLLNNRGENRARIRPVLDKVTPYQFLQRYPSKKDAQVFAWFFIDGSDCWFMPLVPCEDIEGVENVVIDGKQEHFISALGTRSPAFAEAFTKYRAKQYMINHTDVYASISYMEAQLDALTRIVLAGLADGNPYKPILEAADAHSVLDIKDAGKAVAELNADKAAVRALQKQYYKNKKR